MPMGPIALLDFVGLDVSQAIGERSAPRCQSVCASWSGGGARPQGGRGFYDYDA
jgi:3-hydroxybutyryl-CoA dehydrogenase